MAVDPKTLDDVGKIENLKANAERLGRQDLVTACIRRISQLEGQKYAGPLEQRFWEIIAIFEQLRTRENGKTTRASRTRQKVERVGVVKTLEDLALNSKPSDGFYHLIKADLKEYLFEYLVLQFPEKFSPGAVVAAKTRLAEYHLPISDPDHNPSTSSIP